MSEKSHVQHISKILSRAELPIPTSGYDEVHFTVPSCDGCLWFCQRVGEAPIHPGWDIGDVLVNCCESCIADAWLEEQEGE